MKEVVLDPQAIEDIKWWIKQDKKLALKIMELIEDLPTSPFSGKGKPEKLRWFSGNGGVKSPERTIKSEGHLLSSLSHKAFRNNKASLSP